MATSVRFHDDLQPAGPSLRDAALAGLAATPKAIAPKFFYDRRGSELFERICQQPEYYLTRTEEAILAAAANDLAGRVGQGGELVELGSGASRKVRLLLDALRPARYLAIDLSTDFLLSSTQRLAADYPWLEVSAACLDYSQGLRLPGEFTLTRPLLFFPGSSIGNFAPEQALAFLQHLHALLPAGGALLVGVDLPKDKAVLEAAYNDAAQVTKAFNLNLLERLRETLACDIDPSRFEHRAFFNEAESCIEMHLVSREPQEVTLEGRTFRFEAGESLLTERSYKYSVEGFTALGRQAGFVPAAVWTDPQRLFSVHLLRREAPGA